MVGDELPEIALASGHREAGSCSVAVSRNSTRSRSESDARSLGTMMCERGSSGLAIHRTVPPARVSRAAQLVTTVDLPTPSRPATRVSMSRGMSFGSHQSTRWVVTSLARVAMNRGPPWYSSVGSSGSGMSSASSSSASGEVRPWSLRPRVRGCLVRLGDVRAFARPRRSAGPLEIADVPPERQFSTYIDDEDDQ